MSETGAHEVMDASKMNWCAQGLIDEVQVLETSRIGGCSDGPEIMVYPEGVHYGGLTADDIPFVVEEHFLKAVLPQKLYRSSRNLSDEELRAPTPKEVRVVLRNCGEDRSGKY